MEKSLLNNLVALRLSVSFLSEKNRWLNSKFYENSSDVFLSHIFDELDIIIGPTIPVASFAAEKNVPEGWDQSDIFSWTPYTYPFNLTKHPASTINCNFTNNIDHYKNEKKIIFKSDIFGRNLNTNSSIIILHYFQDGSVKKIFKLD